MRRFVISLAALAAVLAVPSLASAHTGTVACVTNPTDATKSGVTFSYQANFAHNTLVTENVNGVTKTFLVHANTASTDTIPAPSASVIAGATWSDGGLAGSIPFVSLKCAFTPPAVTPAPPVQEAAAAVCTPTTTTVTTPGATQYVDRVKTKIVYRTRVKWRTRIKLIKFHEVKQPKHGVLHSGGVTG